MDATAYFLVLTVLTVTLRIDTVHSWWLGDAGGGSIYCKEVTFTFTKDAPYDSDSMPLPSCFTTYFKLFTRTVRDFGISKSYIPSAFSPSKKTVFIVHGFRDSYDDPWIALIDTLLSEGDFNVITVDWDEGSFQNIFVGYDNAAANARVAGRALYDLFNALIGKGLSRTNSHCIGHSLGAHVCGYAGQDRKFGRISGMDPAGPELEGLLPGARLSKEDADFVDVIHTNGGGSYSLDYGSLIPMGHLDFYANGGKDQPGCSKWLKRDAMDIEDRELLTELEDLLRQNRGDIDIACSHGRALALYTESVKSEKCKASITYLATRSTEKELYPCSSGCPAVRPVVGYHADDYKDYSGMFGFTTRSNSPYCG